MIRAIVFIMVTLYTMVLQRTRDIAILKANGASNAFLVRQVLAESMLLTFAGAAVGIALSFVATTSLVLGSPIDAADEGGLAIELNKTEDTANGCRSLFLFDNATGHQLNRFQVDLIPRRTDDLTCRVFDQHAAGCDCQSAIGYHCERRREDGTLAETLTNTAAR